MTGIEENDFLLPGTKTEGYYKLVHYLQDFHKKFGGVDPDKIEDKEFVSLFHHGIENENTHPTELILDDFPGVFKDVDANIYSIKSEVPEDIAMFDTPTVWIFEVK